MNLIIIAAVSENNVIGIGGKVPWKIKEDRRRFKDLTLYHPVIMGRKTYESLSEKFRPLPERDNIVLSRTFEGEKGISVARTLDEALIMAISGNDREPYIIGGEQIYDLFLPLSYKIEMTRVHRHYEGDAFFPDVDWDRWNLISEKKSSTNDGLEYSFLTYIKK